VWGEITVGVLAPIVLLSMPAIRRSRSGVFLGALLVVLGLIFTAST